MTGLVLSLFGGLGLLDEAFRLEGFTVVRGPDLLWSQDVRDFHPPSGVFEGCIGGPPCQLFSQLRYLNPKAGEKHGNMIPEFERVVAEAQPAWFLMENVPAAPEPVVDGYVVRSLILNNRWFGGEQDRTRRFSLGTPDGRALSVEVALFESAEYRHAVTPSSRAVPVKLGGSGKVKRTYTEEGKRHGPSQGARERIGEMLRLQGLPEAWLADSPFTTPAQREMIGNGVPLPMGRAIARAVSRAMQRDEAAS